MHIKSNIAAVIARTRALQDAISKAVPAIAGGESAVATRTAKHARAFLYEQFRSLAEGILNNWASSREDRRQLVASIIETYFQKIRSDGTEYQLNITRMLVPANAGMGVVERAGEVGGTDLSTNAMAADDIARARKYILEWVQTPEELGGKKRDNRDDGKTDEEIAEHIEKVLGISADQKDVGYSTAMRDAAAGLIPHIQEFVNTDAPAHRQMPDSVRDQHAEVIGQSLPRRWQQKDTDFSGEIAEEGSRLTPEEARQLTGLILQAWLNLALMSVPQFVPMAIREAKANVEWGSKQGQVI